MQNSAVIPSATVHSRHHPDPVALVHALRVALSAAVYADRSDLAKKLTPIVAAEVERLSLDRDSISSPGSIQ